MLHPGAPPTLEQRRLRLTLRTRTELRTERTRLAEPLLLGTWGVMSAPGDRWEVVMPQVGPTWGCEIFCEAPVSPHPPRARASLLSTSYARGPKQAMDTPRSLAPPARR